MSNIINLPDNIIEAISKPLPPEAIKPHPTKSYLDTINAAFLMKALDDIFGIGGWHISDEGITWIQDKNGKQFACTKVTLTLTEYNISFNAYGGSNNDDPGDMMKGAVTDGFTSCCKQLGIGRHVWMDKKGQDSKTNNYANTRTQGGAAQRPAASPAQPSPQPAPSYKGVKLSNIKFTGVKPITQEEIEKVFTGNAVDVKKRFIATAPLRCVDDVTAALILDKLQDWGLSDVVAD